MSRPFTKYDLYPPYIWSSNDNESGRQCKAYTERVNGVQIRDVIWVRDPGKIPPKFDVVKWSTDESGREYCYSIAQLEWDPHEPCFDFRSIGLRWLEDPASSDKEVIKMILDFCERVSKELEED